MSKNIQHRPAQLPATLVFLDKGSSTEQHSGRIREEQERKGWREREREREREGQTHKCLNHHVYLDTRLYTVYNTREECAHSDTQSICTSSVHYLYILTMSVHILVLTSFVFLFLNHMWLRKRIQKMIKPSCGGIEIVAVEEILNFIGADKYLLFCHYNIIQPYCTSSCTGYDSAVNPS